MRVGLMMAAAAALVCAGQAEAAQFVTYGVIADGYSQTPGYPYTQTPLRFGYLFTVEVDPGYSDPSHFAGSNGSSFQYQEVPHTVNATVTSPDSLSFTEVLSTDGAIPTSLKVNYSALSDPSLFPTAFADGAATGSIFVNRASRGGFGLLYTGTITSFSIYSVSSSFAFPQLVPNLPEPTSWAMMIAGVGAIGAVMRRRSRPRQLAVS